ncbi:hypothetical protein TURU_059286 [Turdus rufiventris]|nr:hypothetical protein TURU_059286 [Turdus rufiventris]
MSMPQPSKSCFSRSWGCVEEEKEEEKEQEEEEKEQEEVEEGREQHKPIQQGRTRSRSKGSGPGAGAKGKDRILSSLQPRDEARKEPEMLMEASCNSLTAVFKKRSCHGNWYPGFCVLVQEVLALREPGSHTLVP